MEPVQHVYNLIAVLVYFAKTSQSLVGQVDVNNAVKRRNAYNCAVSPHLRNFVSMSRHYYNPMIIASLTL